MPTYAYACTACGHRFEVQQSFTDASMTECPECEGRLRKLFNSVGIVFKGSGFYRTDSRKGSSADGSGEKGDAAKQPAAKETSSSAPDTPTGDATSGTTSGAASGAASGATSGKASRKAAGKASGTPASSAA